MKAQCPHCQHSQQLPEASAGGALKCPSCRRTFSFVAPEALLESTLVTSLTPSPPPQARTTPARARTKTASAAAAPPPSDSEEETIPTARMTLPGAPVERTVVSPPPSRPAPEDAPPQPEERTVMVRPPTASPRRQRSARPASVSSATTGSRRALPTPTPVPAPRAPTPVPEVTLPNVEQEPSARDTLSLTEGMRLGGYQLQRKLGAGGMGTVWLARQLSLDRDVALKILRPSLASDPQFVYRFAQEAFAAAQLVHHNIVQIYDCGSEKQIHFFSMEYVDAESLQSLITREGRLDPEVAAGYILQAARGLKFAHERGMVHRDIKPDNLLLNHNGIVKVADMGLVKRSRATLAQKDSAEALLHSLPGADPEELAMGTPGYMAPEQAENSSEVDARADMYSLGCTFYHLLTGRPPFVSDSVIGLMTQHIMERPLPPDERVRRVPPVVSELVMKMLAKRPDERFQSMAELIRQLEAFLGVEGSASFSPREEHANLLERCVEGFNAAPWGRRRRWLVMGFALLSALGTGLAGWRLGPLWALAVASFAASTWMSSFIIRGLLQKGALFLFFRQFVFQAPLITWLLWLLLLGGGGYSLYHYRPEWIAPACGLLAAALVVALGFYALVDREAASERQPFVEEVEQMLRSMRLRGLEEGALRQFVCKYSGEAWEAFYEALFGFEAKLLAREKWGRNDRGLPRKKHATWREPLIRWMGALQQARQRRRERRQLRMLETRNEKAQEQEKAPA